MVRKLIHIKIIRLIEVRVGWWYRLQPFFTDKQKYSQKSAANQCTANPWPFVTPFSAEVQNTVSGD
jgi:hypothetical protein